MELTKKMKIVRPEALQGKHEEKELVYKGKIFDVYQWQQRMYDGTTETFESLKRADTAVVIPVTPEGKILLTEQEQPGKKPFIDFAGGRLEEGESPVEGAKREVLEELGYEVGEISLLDSTQVFSKIDWVIYYFVARNCRKVAEQQLDPGEKIVIKEVNFDELVDIFTENKINDLHLAVKFLRAKIFPAEMKKLRHAIIG